MSHAEIIRAWKDPDYRSTLSVVPRHPAGLIELLDPELKGSPAARDGSLRFERAYSTGHGGCSFFCTAFCTAVTTKHHDHDCC